MKFQKFKKQNTYVKIIMKLLNPPEIKFLENENYTNSTNQTSEFVTIQSS